MRSIPAFLTIPLITLLVGCSKSPEELCDYVAKVYAANGKPLSDEQRSQCVSEVGEDLRECRNGSDIGDCIAGVNTPEGVRRCRDTCHKD